MQVYQSNYSTCQTTAKQTEW